MAKMAGGPPAHEVYSVSRLNREAKNLLETRFPRLWIEGEISNVSRPASGHVYFCLKDQQMQVRCALFRAQARKVSCQPDNGLSVLAYAQVSLYEGRGDFQLIVEQVEEAGEGALRRAFEALKTHLAQEGLFDASRKRGLPVLPRRIGVLTSPTGAALRDILTTLKRRFPAIPVLVYPIPVQGAGAALQIAAAIGIASARADCDALILARGGGSLEDLWPFNDEVVARAIFDCQIPIISGIGHETDFTIADLVADVRAPTPTAAAELLSPDRGEWLDRFSVYERRLMRASRRELERRAQRVDVAALRLLRPNDRLRSLGQALSVLRHRLQHACRSQLAQKQGQVTLVSTKLRMASPQHQLESLRVRFRSESRRVISTIGHLLSGKHERFLQLAGRLEVLSPLATLTRGYSIIQRDRDGAVIRRAADVVHDEILWAQLAEGRIRCRADQSPDAEPLSGAAPDRTD